MKPACLENHNPLPFFLLSFFSLVFLILCLHTGTETDDAVENCTEVGSVGYGSIQFVVSRIFFVRSMRSVSSNKNIYKSINVRKRK